MPDRPAIARRLRQILDAAREGRLAPEDFAYVRAGFFPGTARLYETQLRRLGSPTRVELVERRALGDDVISTYEVTFPSGVFYVRLGLAPDDRISAFSIWPKPAQ